MRVLAAISGGVDSAVAAARLIAAGHEVSGAHLRLTSAAALPWRGGCRPPGEADDALRVADALGVELSVLDFSKRFAAEVEDYFVEEYRAGRTPNPCLRCNQRIKFAALLERALELGFDAVATGHYARLVVRDGRPELRRARDSAKDQSYVLGVLTSAQLARSMFPLGDSLKSEVRAEAARAGLFVADKPDSSDICFIPDGDTSGYLASRLGAAPGDVVDADGTVLGRHRGVHLFTVGQRRGLGLGRPAPDGRPRYVRRIDAEVRVVEVGPAESLSVRAISGRRATWTQVPVEGRWRAHAQIRAHGEPMACEVVSDHERVEVRLDHPCRGAAPGQSVVLYRGDWVVGSAEIVGAR